MKYNNGTITQRSIYNNIIRACFLCFFYNPYNNKIIMSLFNSKNFSFTCPHSFFTCSKQIACLLLLLRQPRIEFTNVRGKIQSVGLCTQYTNEMCAPFCTSPNCSTDSSPQNVLTCNLALGQETVVTQRARYS